MSIDECRLMKCLTLGAPDSVPAFSLTNHQSPITNHQSPITNHQSPITNHQSVSPQKTRGLSPGLPMCISYPNCGILKFYGYIIRILIASSNERGCFGLPFKLPGATK
jgi:hypothetical protein